MLLIAGLVSTPAQASGAPDQPAAVPEAPDAPGAMSHFDLARKDCLGTARNGTSKVWFTVANGVLSDVYYPTIDNTNNETLQFVVTDGSTFTQIGSAVTLPSMAATQDAGVIHTAHSTTPGSATFSNLQIVTSPFRAPPAPCGGGIISVRRAPCVPAPPVAVRVTGPPGSFPSSPMSNRTVR